MITSHQRESTRIATDNATRAEHLRVSPSIGRIGLVFHPPTPTPARSVYNTPMRTLRALALLFCLAVAIPAGNVSNGSNTCPTSGTKRIASASIKSISFTVQAPAAPVANTGYVCLGGSAVTTTTGVCLGGGDSFTFSPASNTAQYDLTQIYFVCSVNTDLITYTYLQ